LTETTTLEVRWFLREGHPDAATAWFRAEDDLVRADRRTDYYLNLFLEQLGIKLREGNLEIKLREKDLGIRKFTSGVAGRCGLWRKLSLPIADEAVETLPDMDPRWWVSITKERQLRLFDARGESIPTTARVTDGCSLELTRLAVGEQSWWTVGFEAFGREESLESILSVTVKRSCEEAAVAGLEADSSWAYPELLARIAIGRETVT
jgi:hypothetical protein